MRVRAIASFRRETALANKKQTYTSHYCEMIWDLRNLYVCTSSVSLHAKPIYSLVHPVLVYMLSPYIRLCIQC